MSFIENINVRLKIKLKLFNVIYKHVLVVCLLKITLNFSLIPHQC